VVTVSSTGAGNQFQADDNGHVGRPCEVSLAPPYPELFTSYGASAVTRTSGRAGTCGGSENQCHRSELCSQSGFPLLTLKYSVEIKSKSKADLKRFQLKSTFFTTDTVSVRRLEVEEIRPQIKNKMKIVVEFAIGTRSQRGEGALAAGCRRLARGVWHTPAQPGAAGARLVGTWQCGSKQHPAQRPRRRPTGPAGTQTGVRRSSLRRAEPCDALSMTTADMRTRV
jgi:hypothetical protein